MGTDVTILRDGDVVHWDWLDDVPMQRGVSFAADLYDAEVARVAADLSWETPERIAGRLILTNVDRARLLAHGLKLTHVGVCRELFQVVLELEGDYQIFVATPWRGRRPEEVADAMCVTLAGPPDVWQVRWHAIKFGLTEPPTIAGPSWQRWESSNSRHSKP